MPLPTSSISGMPKSLLFSQPFGSLLGFLLLRFCFGFGFHLLLFLNSPRFPSEDCQDFNAALVISLSNVIQDYKVSSMPMINHTYQNNFLFSREVLLLSWPLRQEDAHSRASLDAEAGVLSPFRKEKNTI